MKRLLIFIVVLGIIAGLFYLFFAEGSLPANKKETGSVIFVVRPGEGMSEIAKNLAGEGLIRNKVVFYLIVKQLGIEKNIQAGDFRLSKNMNAYEIARALTHGTLDEWVTVIEGLRKEEIAQIMSQKLGIPEVEFIKYAKEGYLFPDTYLFPRQSTAEGVIAIMMANFNSKYTEEMRKKAEALNLTENQVVTLASIVEREAKSYEDRQKVASILLKRYRSDWPLQSDITVEYVVGYDEAERTWWKEGLTVDELAIDSPYNTRKNKGLPPGPVDNPGLSSIQAVVNADISTPYWFYISDTNGAMHYAKTQEEHDANVKRYLQ